MTDDGKLENTVTKQGEQGQPDVQDAAVEAPICDRCKAPDAIVDACPYSSEINGNETPCTCCRSCRHECAMDI